MVLHKMIIYLIMVKTLIQKLTVIYQIHLLVRVKL